MNYMGQCQSVNKLRPGLKYYYATVYNMWPKKNYELKRACL